MVEEKACKHQSEAGEDERMHHVEERKAGRKEHVSSVYMKD